MAASGPPSAACGTTGGSPTAPTWPARAELMSAADGRRGRGRRPGQLPPRRPAALRAAGRAAHGHRRRHLARARTRPGAQVLTTAALGALALQDVRHGDPARRARRAAVVREPPRRGTRRSSSSARTSRCRCPTWSGTPTRSTGAATSPSRARLGARVVTTYLDLIAYDIPRYHGSPEAWHAYRALQRRIALSVDGITTISADVAHRLARGGAAAGDRAGPAAAAGAGPHHARSRRPTQPGEDLDELVKSLRGKRFVAVLGNDFQHKNRDFAIKVWEAALQAGQPCDLVLAGLHVKSSSSKEQEDDLIARHLDLRGRIHTVGHVSVAEPGVAARERHRRALPDERRGLRVRALRGGSPGHADGVHRLRPAGGDLRAFADCPPGGRSSSTPPTSSPCCRARRRGPIASRRSRWRSGGTRGPGSPSSSSTSSSRVTRMPEVATSAVGADTAAADAAALSSILSSRTWRATEPLRTAGQRLRQVLSQGVRRSARRDGRGTPRTRS